MFIEENFETFLLNTLRTLQDTSGDALANIKAFEVIGERDVTLENIGQYAKIAPAVVLGVLDNDVLRELNDKCDTQYLNFQLRVFLFVKEKFSHESRANAARPILRALRDAIRGLRWTKDDTPAATEGVARVKYTGQQAIGAIGGIVLYLQTYDIHTPDYNDTRRTL